MHCDICGQKNAYIRKIDRTYGKGKHTVSIRNIPIATCTTCDERYFKSNIFDDAKQLNSIPKLRVNESEAMCHA